MSSLELRQQIHAEAFRESQKFSESADRHWPFVTLGAVKVRRQIEHVAGGGDSVHTMCERERASEHLKKKGSTGNNKGNWTANCMLPLSQMRSKPKAFERAQLSSSAAKDKDSVQWYSVQFGWTLLDCFEIVFQQTFSFFFFFFFWISHYYTNRDWKYIKAPISGRDIGEAKKYKMRVTNDGGSGAAGTMSIV